MPKLNRVVLFFAFLVPLFLNTGCLTTKSYVDPTLPKVALSDLQAVPNPAPIVLKTNFQTQGKDNLQVTGMIYDQASAVLRSTGMFSQVLAATAGDAPRLDINMNNVGDLGAAVGKGIGTGLTLGLAGSMVTDGYIFTAKYTKPGSEPVSREYKHAIHSTIGNKSGPPGLKPVTNAFDQVLRELVLKLLKDLQDEGQL